MIHDDEAKYFREGQGGQGVPPYVLKTQVSMSNLIVIFCSFHEAFLFKYQLNNFLVKWKSGAQ